MPAEEPGEGDGKSQHIWSLLPSFDPSTDSAREYIEKVKFIDGICPKKDRAMLAPRLAMLCRGTAWGQVKSLPSASLVDETNGVKNLLAALSTWEESSEMRTFELSERAIYKTTQRPDESSLSFVNRLQVAFNELGSTTIDEMRAFLLLRQSALTSEDKKKVLTMTQGKMDKGLIEQSMRTLATSILSGEPKKKIYPINYVEPEVKEVPETDPTVTAYYTQVDEEDVDQESIEQLANQGDADALQVQAFEKDLEDLFQEIPDMHHALISYQTARQKLVEKKKYRGFWPSGRGKGSHSFGGGGGKFGKKGKGKTSLLARIANSHCKHCGEKGHWKDECPNKPKDTVNVVTQVTSPPGLKHYEEKNDDQVIFEEFTEEAFTVIGEPGPSTIEELYHAATFEKPSEQTLEEFAKSLKSSRSSASSQDCHSHTTVVGLSKFACDFMTEENKSRSDRDKHKEGHFEKDPIIASHKTEEVDCLFAIEENTRFHAIRFLSHRLASRRAEHHLPETLLPKAKSLGECFVSKSSGEVSGGHGMAILDTGASRSVVGEDIVPALMKSLPDIIRSMVCESPSKVGFRFGNNQITYSFKQLKIPILQKGMRVWLVIEVVPKATPFLLSIHAMKTLGACIDLDTNKCFLKRLGRSLQLKQSRNGLYLVNLQELCLPSEEKTHDSLHVNTTATAESKVSSPPDLCSSSDPVDHAIAEGSDRSSQGNSPECGRESEVSAKVILMSQLEVLDSDRAVPDDQAQAIQRLNNEVISQRNRIEEIARLLRQPGSPSRFDLNLSTTLNSDDEFEHVDLAGLPTGETSPPRRSRATGTSLRVNTSRTQTSQPVVTSTPATYPVPAPSTPATVPAPPMAGTQLVHTAQALESWGCKRISWGKKHISKQYREVYEIDPGYVEWIRARASTLTPAMSDFLMYCQAREGVEQSIHQ